MPYRLDENRDTQIRKRVMKTNDLAEHRREETKDGIIKRLREMAGEAEQLAKTGRDIANDLAKE